LQGCFYFPKSLSIRLFISNENLKNTTIDIYTIVTIEDFKILFMTGEKLRLKINVSKNPNKISEITLKVFTDIGCNLNFRYT
jgi:hypothetical protein